MLTLILHTIVSVIMNGILLLILIITIILIVRRWTRGFIEVGNPRKGFIETQNNTFSPAKSSPVEDKPVGYKKRFSVMNDSESALFFELQKQLPFDYHIFPNMRLADIVDAINGYGFYKRRNKILPRHIDFVICDSFFKPVVAVELNGNSHNRQDRMEMDEEKKKILEEAQIPLITVKVGDSFIEAVLEIKSYL